jgi:hypothetical protein
VGIQHFSFILFCPVMTIEFIAYFSCRTTFYTGTIHEELYQYVFCVGKGQKKEIKQYGVHDMRWQTHDAQAYFMVAV